MKCFRCENEIIEQEFYWCEECDKGVMPDCWKNGHYIVKVCSECYDRLEENAINGI